MTVGAKRSTQPIRSARRCAPFFYRRGASAWAGRVLPIIATLTLCTSAASAEPFIHRTWKRGQVIHVEDNPETKKANEAETLRLESTHLLRPRETIEGALAIEESREKCRRELADCQSVLQPEPGMSTPTKGAIVALVFLLGLATGAAL